MNSITITFGNKLAKLPMGIGEVGYKILYNALNALKPLIVGQYDQTDNSESGEDLDKSD